MAILYGRTWSRQALLEHFSTMDAAAGIKFIEGADGKERGVRMFEVWTGSGLNFRVLADRGMDISACSYKGVPLAWASTVGDAHPAYFEPSGMGWLRTFQGGLLTTCGLDQMGSPSEDNGEHFGLHGRISASPAHALHYRGYWEGDDYYLELSGEVRQTRVFGENLVLRRRFTTQLGSSIIRIEDTVTNEGHAPNPHLILYHFNLGFPLINNDAILNLDAHQTLVRDADAEKGLATWNQFHAPIAGYREQVFRHSPKADSDGKSRIGVSNLQLGIRLQLTFDQTALPHVFQWKMLGAGMYVLGLEPANSTGIRGRANARELQDLPHLQPGETRAYNLEIAVSDL